MSISYKYTSYYYFLNFATFACSNLMVPLTTELRSEMSLNRMDGYLTVKESSNNWVRQFFVIQGSEMYYYHKKEVLN